MHAKPEQAKKKRRQSEKYGQAKKGSMIGSATGEEQKRGEQKGGDVESTYRKKGERGKGA